MQTARCTIRKASPAHAPGFARLFAELLLETDMKNHEKCIRSFSHELKTCLKSKECSVYFAQDRQKKIIGYIVAHWIPFPFIMGHEGYVSNLIVLKTCRGEGIGTKLMTAAEKEAKKRGCCRLILNNPRKSESYKRSFYKKHGFTERVNFANFVKPL